MPPWNPLAGSVDREGDDEIGFRAVRNESLRPVDPVTGAVGNCTRAQRERIRARSRLGHRVHADQRSVRQPRQVATLLLVAAEFPHRHHAGQQVRRQREHQAAIVAAVAERFERKRARQRVDAAAAEFLGNRQPLEADFPALLPQRAGKDLVAIARRDIFVERGLREADDVVAQQALLLGKREVHSGKVLEPLVIDLVRRRFRQLGDPREDVGDHVERQVFRAEALHRDQ